MITVCEEAETELETAEGETEELAEIDTIVRDSRNNVKDDNY